MKQFSFFLILLSTALVVSCGKNDYNNNTPPVPPIVSNVVKASGDSTGIIGSVNQFRALLGDSLNTTPNKTSGRREVNWDAVPAGFTNSGNFPFDFFNNTDPLGPNGRKRGLILTNTGTSFRVDSTDFVEIDASYAAQFDAFSKKRLFTYLGNNISEISFKVPGTSTDAFVKGFGLIFSAISRDHHRGGQWFREEYGAAIAKAAQY